MIRLLMHVSIPAYRHTGKSVHVRAGVPVHPCTSTRKAPYLEIPSDIGSLVEDESMEIRIVPGTQEHEEPAAELASARPRSRPLPGVSAALDRPLHGAGLAHWGGPAPGHEVQEPVDVAGTGRPGRLPTTD